MKAFTHLALLALLFQALAMRQVNAASASTVTSTPASAASTATPITTSPPTTDTTAPPGTNTSTAANATAPPGTNNTSTTANATAPPGTNTSTTENPTAPPGTNTSAANPTAPPGTNTSAANPTAPPGTNTSTAANATAPPGTNTSTTANPTAPPGTNTSTTANATAPPGTNNTSTAANATAPPSTNTSTAANATAPPGTNTSTTANPTAPPGTNTSAANPTAPPGTNTSAANATAPPGTNTSAANPTAPPGTNTSAANPTAPPGTNTSTATTGNTTSNTATSTPTSAGPSTPCKEDSCKDGSLCVNLLDDYVCLCSEGYYYKSSKCNKGKIFPGTIKVKMSYTPEFENKTSKAYQNLYTQVTTFFRDTFNNSDYGQTVIVKVSPSASARSEMRAGNQGVDVAVVNMFTESTKENETSISNAIIKAISTHSRNFSGYDPQDRCDYYGCKKPNDQNDCDSGLLCECKEGLARPNPQIPMCVALGPTCSDMCNAEHKSQCLVRNGSAACVCLPGYKEDDQNTCQACAFGYSGVNCEDSFQLILTILGTIAGVVILGMLIALIVSMRLKNKGRDVEEETLIEKDSQNLRLKETGFSNLGAEGSIFPKVRVNLPRDNESQNPYTSPYTLPDY